MTTSQHPCHILSNLPGDIMKLSILPILLSLSLPFCNSADPTTEGITSLTTSTPDAFSANCKLEVQIPDKVRYDFVNAEVNIVYVHLEFDDIDLDPKTGYLSNTTHYVTSLRWVLGARARGNLLLQLPSIFGPLSLGSLSLDATSVSVSVKTESCPDFEQASDEEKQKVIAMALIEKMNYSVPEGEVSDFKVCQEFAHLPDALLGDATWFALLLNIYFVVYNTRYECWSDGTDNNQTLIYSAPLWITVAPLWLTVPIIILGILGAVVLPLVVVQFIQRNNSPYVEEVLEQDEHGNKVETGKVNKYYQKITSIPIGAKYIVFFHASPIVVILRFIFGFGLVYIMFCPEIFFRLDDYFMLRFSAYRRSDFIKIPLGWYNVLRAVILLLPLVWFLPSIPSIVRHMYRTRQYRWSNTPNSFRPYHAESSKERSCFGLFLFPDPKYHIPRHPHGISGFSCLYYYMKCRIQTALRGRLLWAVFTNNLLHMWNGVVKLIWPTEFESLWNKMAAILAVLTIPIFMVIVATFNLIILFFSTLVYLLPSAYILSCVTNTHSLIISFTLWAYSLKIWKWLAWQSKNDERVGEEDDGDEHAGDEIPMKVAEVATDDGDQPSTSKTGAEDDPKQTVVEFRKGSSGSGSAYVEGVYTPAKRLTGLQRWLPLPYFYAYIYRSIVPAGESGGRGLCLKICYVFVAVVLSVLIACLILFVMFFLVCLTSVIIILLSSVFVVYFLRILTLCTLLSSFMVLCFTGLVVNGERVLAFCLLGLFLIGFIIDAVTGLYTTYSNLLRTVIKIAKDLRPGLCFVLLEEYKTYKVDGENGETVSKTRESVKAVPITTLQKADKRTEAEVMIEESLFWHVVENTIPLRLTVMSKVIQVIVVVVAVVVAIIVLVDVNELRDFAPFSVNLTILVLTLVFTHVRSLIAVSPEEAKEDLEGGVKIAITKFEDPTTKVTRPAFLYPENKLMLLDCEY